MENAEKCVAMRIDEEIVAHGYKKKYIAERLGISAAALYQKLAGKRQFKLSEIYDISALLKVNIANFFN